MHDKHARTRWNDRYVALFAGAALLLAGCDGKPSAPAPAAPPAAAPPQATAAQPAKPAVGTLTPRVTGTLLDRAPDTDIRLVSYNVLWNSVFEDVDPDRAAKFARLVAALAPDVLALQEIGMHPEDRGKPGGRARTAAEVAALLDRLLPLTGGRWQAHQGSDAVIATRFPLTMKATRVKPEGDRDLAIALVDLPDTLGVDLYVLNNHYKCCDPAKNDPRRQQQSDALAAWLRDARTAGGEIDLAPHTAIAIVGDLNVVGSFQPVTTLLTGDIADETVYGADALPDWDGTTLVDLHPRHNVDGTADWTWRSDAQEKEHGFKPARLDFILFSDSVLEPARAFALNTTTMTPADRSATGLQEFDTCNDNAGHEFDHLPIVADFRVRTP